MIECRMCSLAMMLAVLVPFGVGRAEDKIEVGFVALFNGNDLAGFRPVLDKGRSDEAVKTFTVKDGAIAISGHPGGYLSTDKSYKNYVLRFEWKFDREGGGGVLLHITGGHKVWPHCIEMHADARTIHGHMNRFGRSPAGEFQCDAGASKKAFQLNEWNTIEIVSRNGELTSKVNGVQVCTGKSALVEGPIGWQSEGTAYQVKNIRIKLFK